MSEIAKSAKQCLTKEHYLYNYETEGVHLVLDCVFNVEGVTFKGQTSQAYESLDGAQKVSCPVHCLYSMWNVV